MSHVKDMVTCYTCIVMSPANRVFMMYLVLRNVMSGNMQQQLKPEFDTISNNLRRIVLTFSDAALEFYISVVLYLIKERLVIFRHALEKYKSNHVRNSAWSECSTVSCRRAHFADHHISQQFSIPVYPLSLIHI